MNARCVDRPGATLVELLVTLSILGIIAGVTTLAIRRFDPPRPADPLEILADSVRQALGTSRPARIRITIGGRAANAVVGIDGSIVADSVFGVERFTGAPGNAR